MYEFITAGMDAERLEKFDRTLEAGTKADEKTKARREREAMERLMKLPGG